MRDTRNTSKPLPSLRFYSTRTTVAFSAHKSICAHWCCRAVITNGPCLLFTKCESFFAPASVQKLFTVSSALMNLKPNYRFPTRLLMTGQITNGVLHGDLIFQFNGDPTLTQSNLVQFVGKLRSLGIQKFLVVSLSMTPRLITSLIQRVGFGMI